MKPTTPLISVIVPCYNQAEYMDECLTSVLAQTYQNWECIIVNDGSPDNTEEIALQWTAKDPRFKYLKKENGGLSSARNAGIEIAKGEWILPLDSDDKIGDRYMELAEKKFDVYDLIYCDAEFFGDKEGQWQLPIFNSTTIAIQNTIFCTAFFRKKDWEKHLGYDTNLVSGYEDWDFWLKLISNGIQVYKIDKVLFYYRIKEKSMTTNFHDNLSSKNRTYAYIVLKFSDFISSQNIDLQNNLIENDKLKEKIKLLETKLNTLHSRKVIKLLNKIEHILKKIKI